MNHASTGRDRYRTAAVALVVFAALLAPAGAAASSDLSPPSGTTGGSGERSLERGPRTLPSSELQELSERFDRGEPTGRVANVQGNRVRVLIEHRLPPASAGAALAALGATQPVHLGSTYIEASVPIDRLETLQSQPWVHYLQPAPRVSPRLGQVPSSLPLSVDGGEVAKAGADSWHAVGLDGTGVGIGIIDDFDLGVWNAARANGDLPAPAGTACFDGGIACDVWTVTPGATHGTSVAEIVHEMAPGASLYLANGFTLGDLRSAIDYFATQGVQVINFSATFPYDGPGDGTGPSAGIIDYAVSKGIAWINSAGNFAGGAYWRGTWTDTDGDGWLEFAGGVEEMYIRCGWALGLRWDDWNGGIPTDYDVYIWDTIAEASARNTDFAKARSENVQTAAADPIENFGSPLQAAGCVNGELDLISVYRRAPGDGSTGDILEIGMSQWLQFPSNAYSAAVPLGDTANPGALSVGAIDPPLGTTVASYSSRGPTNDGRIKPDLTAPAGMLTLSSGAFAGTSAAAPVVAGAAALLFQAGLANSPSGLKSYLLSNSVVDRSTAGPDNDYGSGELRLGPVAVDDDFGGTEDISLAVAAPGVLGNDGDPEGDGLSVAQFDASSAGGGTVAMEADGSFTYDPPADLVGDDTFSYTVSDGARSDTAEVTVTLEGQPDPPAATEDAFGAVQNTLLSVAAPGVLANDSDPDGDGLSVSGFDIDSVNGGSVTVGPDGSFTYDPPVGFIGDDSFSYTVSDGSLTDTATVAVTVAGPPVATDDGYETGHNTTLVVSAPGVLENDSDPEGDGLVVLAFDVSSVRGADVTVEADGSFSYDPPAGLGGIDSFTYTVSDGTLTDTATVTVTVGAAPSSGGGGGGGIPPPAPPLPAQQEACPATLPAPGFFDLSGYSAEAVNAINCLAAYEISLGTGPATYSPDGRVTRWQMALFLTRLITAHGVDLPIAADQGFVDIVGLPASTRAAIDQLAVLGITRGTTAATFDPDGSVTRWQMALFLTRIATLVGITLSDGPSGSFADLAGFPPETRTAVNQLADAGIARGTSATTFAPNADVLRWQMALFLARVLQAGGVTLQ